MWDGGGGGGGGGGEGGGGRGGGGGGLLHGRNDAVRSSCSIRPGGSRCLSGY